ncbi:NEDD4-binding protein 2-like 2 [Triplophysa rosa]|uniref:NEDD4-binding protein 2-like 2 n=1 Tax=Triplophysa rosa TaxID=992332 RepID=A0A9W7TPV1_TRIRA|nr:NEDD4-binding protein 2-like 2 [Triplophysa rosa]KAI7801110.1 putative NEDD4-binding protein 2-like 2 [Triplophysa rosa]
MPDVNASESTSPSEGGNVEVAYANTTQTNLRGLSAVLTSNSHTNSDTSVSDELTSTCSLEATSEQDRNRVIQDLGITSTAFIGPACRPEPPSIEQELSEFYKELQEVDHSDEVDGHALDEQGQNPSCKPESDPRQKDSSAVVTDRSRAYRPYPDPHQRSGQQWQCGGPRRWRPRTPYGNEGFGERLHLAPWCPPPPWIPPGPPNPAFQFFPPPPFGGPIMYPPYMRPQQNFQSHADISKRAPWEVPWLPPNEWHDNARGPSFCDSRFPEDYETSTSNWQQNNPEQQFHHYNTLHLILLRGLPGSGKSTLARDLMSGGPNGTILSTDDYFFQDNTYVFDSTLLADAHDWNQKRAEHAMSEGRSPVIIDNTNIKAWEMKPYVKMALKNGYKVDVREPETNWKYDPIQLEKRNTHGVPRETIEKMLDRFERPVDIDIVMNSAEPPHKSRAR